MDFIIAQVVYLRWKKVLTIAVCVCGRGGYPSQENNSPIFQKRKENNSPT
jgi:hypothetical protein